MTAAEAPAWLEGARATAVLLAGGRGERVGRDKASLMIGGTSLIDRSLAAFDAIGLPVVIALRLDQMAPRGRVVVRDVAWTPGPMAGLLAALEQTTAEWAFVAAVDMPLLAPELLGALYRVRGEADAVVPRVGGHDHVLASWLHVRALPALRTIAEAGERSVTRCFAQLKTRYVTAAELVADPDLARVDPALSSLTNVNTPEDVAEVEALLQHR